MTQKKIENLIKNNRVCPKPDHWNNLWQKLKNKERAGMGWKPPLPLILSAWYNTSNLEKNLRFNEHLQWAQEQGQIDEIFIFLENLMEEDWHHHGD